MSTTTSVEPGQTWMSGSRVLQVQANGTPTTFKVAEFTVPGLRIVDAFEMDKEKLSRKLESNGFSLYDKRFVIR